MQSSFRDSTSDSATRWTPAIFAFTSPQAWGSVHHLETHDFTSVFDNVSGPDFSFSHQRHPERNTYSYPSFPDIELQGCFSYPRIQEDTDVPALSTMYQWSLPPFQLPLEVGLTPSYGLPLTDINGQPDQGHSGQNIYSCSRMPETELSNLSAYPGLQQDKDAPAWSTMYRELSLPTDKVQEGKATAPLGEMYFPSPRLAQCALPLAMRRVESLGRNSRVFGSSLEQTSGTTDITHLTSCTPEGSRDISSLKQVLTGETAFHSMKFSDKHAPGVAVIVAVRGLYRTPLSSSKPLYIVQERKGDLQSKVFGIRMYASFTEKSGHRLHVRIHHDSLAPYVFNRKPNPSTKQPDQWFYVQVIPSQTVLEKETLAETLESVSGVYQGQISKWGLSQADREFLDTALNRIGNGDIQLETGGAEPEKPWNTFKYSCEEWKASNEWTERNNRMSMRKRNRRGARKRPERTGNFKRLEMT